MSKIERKSNVAVLKVGSAMASSTVPAKSQPLHNFDLPCSLKWNNDAKPTTNHHRRRPVKSPIRLESSSIGGDSVNRSPVRVDSACHFQRRDSVLVAEESKTLVKSKGVAVGHRRNHSNNNNNNNNNNNLDFETNPLKSFERGTVERFEKKPIKGSSKICIKIPCNNNKLEESTNERPLKAEINDKGGNYADNISIDEEAKKWNLRPRKPLLRKCVNVNVGGVAVKNTNGYEKCKAQSPSKIRNNKSEENQGRGTVEKEKQRLTVNVSLTKDEIEEDIFAFTGSKASRRPKKRPRNVQKQLDYVFPGLWLVSITPDSYKVSENSMKG